MIQTQYMVDIPLGQPDESERFEAWCNALPRGAVSIVLSASTLYIYTQDKTVAEAFQAYGDCTIDAWLDAIDFHGSLSAADHLNRADAYEKWGLTEAAKAENQLAEEKFNA